MQKVKSEYDCYEFLKIPNICELYRFKNAHLFNKKILGKLST